MAGLVPAIHAVRQGKTVESESGGVLRRQQCEAVSFLQLNRVDGRDKPGQDGKRRLVSGHAHRVLGISPKSKPPKRRIGYARVSTEAQDLTHQQKALKRAGCDPDFSDKASGKSMARRPALAEALAELDAGDELVFRN